MTGGRRLAITGATGDFGRSVLRWALAEDTATEVTVLGRRSPGMTHPKLREASLDLSGPFDLDAVAGYDALIHLAYCVEEPRDKRLAHRVNVVATRILLEEANRVGIGHLTLTSSANALGVSACGTGEQLPENSYPAGDRDFGNYYFQHKAMLEHLANWYWTHSGPRSTRLAVARPCYVVGEHFANTGLAAFQAKTLIYPSPGRSYYQFLWDTDLVDAYATIVDEQLVGTYNIAPVDQTGVRELSRMTGARLIPGPLAPLRIGSNVLYRLRVTPFSGHWVTLGDPLLNSHLLRSTTGWRPSSSSSEAWQRYLAVSA